MWELDIPEITDEFESLGMPIEESTFYAVETSPSTNGISDNTGMYSPRKKTGYVEFLDDLDSTYHNFAHEAGHASFFENTPIGLKITELEKEVHQIERRLFGNPRDQKFEARPSKEVDSSLLIGENPKTYLVNKSNLKKYRKKRTQLNQFVEDNIGIIEGYAVLMEEEIIGDIERELPPIYKQGYNQLTKARNKTDLDSVINFLKQ